METRADNLVISNSFVKVECLAEEYPKESTVYGFYNNLANSVSMQNTYIYAINRGDGNRQKAVGVYTNGRFGRFVGNNIKANGTLVSKRSKHTYSDLSMKACIVLLRRTISWENGQVSV